MQRRTLLNLAWTLGTLLLAGCADNGASSGDTPDTGSSTPTATPGTTATATAEPGTPSPTVTPAGTPGGAIETATLTVQDIAGGQQTDTVTVSFQNGAVVVDGTIWGSDGCKTAVLEATEYGAGSDRLSVAVATTDREDAGDACTQAIVEIDYRVRVTFSDGLPGAVAVTHDGRAVTTVDRDTS